MNLDPPPESAARASVDGNQGGIAQPRLTIRSGLSLAFGALLGLTLLICLLAWLLYDELGSDLDIMSGTVLPRVVQSRNLAMANNRLATLAGKLAMASTREELERLAQFGKLASQRLQQTLREAESGMFELDQLTLLRQINGQVARILELLNRAVREHVELRDTLEAKKRLVRHAGEQAGRQIEQKLKILLNKRADAQAMLYVASLNLIRDAEWQINAFSEDHTAAENERQQETFQHLRTRFNRLAGQFVERGLDNYHLLALQKGGWNQGDLLSLQHQLVEVKNRISALLSSSDQLNAQFRLLTTVIVKRSSEQVQQVREEALADIAQRKQLMAAMMVFSLGLSALLIWYFGHRRMARPLEHLSRAVSSFEQGKIEAVPTRKGVREVQELSHAFNRMTQTLGTRDRELRQLHLLLRNVIDSLAPILLAVDRNCCLTLWNLQAEKCCEPSVLVVGHPVSEVLNQLPIEMTVLQQAVENGESLLLKNLQLEQQGEQRTYELSSYPLVDALSPGAVLRVEDVTERLQIEKTIAQSEKMISVGGLAAGIAHEINNPLAGVLQNAQVLGNRLNPSLPKNIEAARSCGIDMEKVDQYLQKRGIIKVLDGICGSANQAAKIVRNLLAFSRPGQGIDSRSFEPQDLAVLVDTTVELLATDYNMRHDYDFRQIRIERHFADQLPAVVCEGSLIQQVVFNILKNCVQALSSTKGEQDAPCIKLTLQQRAKMLSLMIEDNGPGMSAEARQRVFEPFYTTQATGQETGLGMSVAYFIVTEYHQGTIEVESEAGKGSSFIITLPVQRKELAG